MLALLTLSPSLLRSAPAGLRNARRVCMHALPTPEEMQPGSPEMLARAKAAAKQYEDRVLTPLEAFSLIGDEDAIELVDVRTVEQQRGHEINGKAGRSILGAVSTPLDDIVAGTTPPPDGSASVVLLACSKGPKSLVALDYLAASGAGRFYCIEGGITAWEQANLPMTDVASAE
eukprot:6143821-Prymnesium_polylepis.1